MAHASRSFAFCPDHPKAHVVEEYASGDNVCSECGLVVGDRIIDNRSEWRTFSNSDKGANKDPSRVGGPQDQDDDTLADLRTSDVPGGDNDKWKRGTMSSAQRSRLLVYNEISRVGSVLKVSESIMDRARSLFRRLEETKTLKSRNRDAVAVVCLFLACREMRAPRSLKELCDVTTIPKKMITRIMRLAMDALGLNAQPTAADDLVTRTLGRLGQPSLRPAAMHVARQAEASGLVTGRSPTSIMAACVYLVCLAAGCDVTPSAVSQAAGVGDATISLIFRILEPVRDTLLPLDFKPLHDKKSAVAALQPVGDAAGLKLKREPGT